MDESWAVKRHALGRILHIVAKYGGALTLRSSATELKYIASAEGFKRNRNGLGYKPNRIEKIEASLPGSHIQIILPLFPQIYVDNNLEPKSVYQNYLPQTFVIDEKHVSGHLVPLLEFTGLSDFRVGSKDQKMFRTACIKLSEELFNRHPRNEPLILDFSGINWIAPQFETFLFLTQNVLQNRLILIVEIDKTLARTVVDLENQAAETFLDDNLVGETSEKIFFETYSGVQNTVLGLDRDGKRYIFGLQDHSYEEALLSLIDNPRSIKDITTETFYHENLKESYFRTILTNDNPLFWLDKNNFWHCSWEPCQLQLQSSRVISLHFDELLNRTDAWWGRTQNDNVDIITIEAGLKNNLPKFIPKKFNLPWQEEWRDSFLESSKFLSRERYCDEVAQRLLFRLQEGLRIKGRQLEDVKVLASVTAPALLLSTAMCRWWPLPKRPVVADLSFHILLGRPTHLPSIVDIGGIVIVQDILERGVVSGNLISKLLEQSKELLCVISLLRFDKNAKKTELTPINKGWEDVVEKDKIPRHAMIEMRGPQECEAPTEKDDDSNLFWIEPRALHPMSYQTLRRDFEEGRDPYLRRRDQILPKFDDEKVGCLFAAGHYVYGPRHYQVAIDVREMLKGEIGKEIALWIADICEGNKHRKKAEWERKTGYNLKGDITFVLMPLHSQIHYLWPEISKILAQKGRRQVFSFLDATLFTGRKPTYRISAQLEQQINRAALDSIDAYNKNLLNHPKPLRILILDDAIASARSAETMLLGLTRRVKRVFEKAGANIDKYSKNLLPIEWIRYFAILNQMGHANHTLWHNMTYVGEPSIPFVLEEYAPFMGVPLFDESDCPICHERERLKHTISQCMQSGAHTASEAARDYYIKLKPIAIDGPVFRNKNAIPLSEGIDVLGIKSKKYFSSPIKYIPRHADTAIWRFYKLMHLSYPIEDILLALNKAWIKHSDKLERESKTKEYERYRWAVFDWCFKNWSRVTASTARKLFVDCIKNEILKNTPLIDRILFGCSKISNDIYIKELLIYCIKTMERLEKDRIEGIRILDKDRIERIERLEVGLTVFFFSISVEYDEISSIETDKSLPLIDYFISELEKSSKNLKDIGNTLLGNLLTRIKRPKSIASPAWALNALAEALLRGRDPKNAPAGRHFLLPRLIDNIIRRSPNKEDVLLLEGSLSVFLAALDDILPYAYIAGMTPNATNVRDLCEKVLNWLKMLSKEKVIRERPRELRDLNSELDLSGDFIKGFNEIFHMDLLSLKGALEKEVGEYNRNKKMLDFEFILSKDLINSKSFNLFFKFI